MCSTLPITSLPLIKEAIGSNAAALLITVLIANCNICLAHRQMV